jgi:hypothetical protein
VDNLAPLPPAPFVAQPTPAGMALHWGPNHEADLAGYRLYRGEIQEFDPSSSCLVAAVQDTGYFDPTGDAHHFYKLAAVDLHGNEGAHALVAATSISDVTAPALDLALEGARPNPATDGRLVVWFTLPADGPATVELLDLAGRKVSARAVGALGAGRHSVEFGERRVSAGVYWIRLTRAGRSLSTRVALVR